MITIGIDIGSTASKAVLLNGTKELYEIMPTGWSPKETGKAIVSRLLEKGHLRRDQVSKIVATGYGRDLISIAHKAVTEITCHGRGAAFLVEDADMVIDIGGQDSKVIKIHRSGRVIDFIMNDKCAAGTGRFLEVTAISLGLDVSELEQYHDRKNMVSINSMCTVFAETEVISLLAGGIGKEKIVAGLHSSVAGRVANMAKKLGVGSKIVFTGGVSLNGAVREMLKLHLEADVLTPALSQYAGAMGAALIARDMAN